MIRPALVLLLLASSPALAEPPAPLADRAKILALEMRRGPAEGLAPYLAPDAHTLLRQAAIRALGRIGDRGKAPEILAKLLETERTQLPLALWAAGIARTESLAEPIAKHLESDDPLVAAAAAEALGWTGAEGAASKVALMLNHPDAHVRTGTLRGLARLRPEAMLERLLIFLDAEGPGERAAAEFAFWRTAEARGQAAREIDPGWKAGNALSFHLHHRYAALPPESALMRLRAIAALWPDPVRPRLDWHPRILQEFARRILLPGKGGECDAFIAELLDHADPLVRRTAAEVLGKHGTAEPLRARFAKEKDLRIRDVLAVELARCGDESAWKSIADDPARQEIEEVTRLLTRAEVLLASPRKEALAELCAWLTPEPKRHLPTAVLVRILWQLGGREHPAIEPLLNALVDGPFACSDDHILAAAVGVMFENRYLRESERPPRQRGVIIDAASRFFPLSSMPQCGPETRVAWATAVGEVAKDPAAPAILHSKRILYVRWQENEPSPWVRLAARDAAVALGYDDVPDEDDLPANDWKGLPRPKGPVLGLDLTGEGEWLDETEILRLADRIAVTKTRVDLVTTAGTMRFEIYPEHAPVHCASLVLSAVRGTYRNTRFHRVVPSFVIQGGDPRGHGAGNAGFTIPDEIGPIPFDRGVLGMPKSRKDDGGCQLFVMHTPYPRLDELYTSYGRVVTGLEVVDEIRVGDLILDVRLVP